MEILSPEVLLNLLEQTPSHEAKPVLLQIRSIVPVLTESLNDGQGVQNDDLWPKQGFRLKVADSSHAMYVSLPQEQNDMVLRDELRLGQLILAEKLEIDELRPAPVLRGIRPVPGRHACLGDPEDLDHEDTFASLDEASEGLFSPLSGMSLSSSSSARMAKRRSWIIGVEGSSGCSVSKPNYRRKSVCVSTSRIEFTKYDRSNGNSSSKKKTPKLIENSKKSVTCNTFKSVKNCDASLKQAMTPLSPLPRNLAKLGKEVERCRDLALLASVDALQEASAAEKLLKCLKTFLELKSLNSKDKEKHPSTSSLNMFFNLQQALAETRLILQSLTNTKSLIRPNDTDQNSHNSTKESPLEVAEDRKKGASCWINAALASDLVPLSSPSLRKEANIAAKRPTKTCASENKDATIVLGKKRNNSQGWTKGSDLCACIGIASALSEECEKWFLGYAEKYLDGLLTSKKVSSLECPDSEVAQMMRQIKKVSDWLDGAAAIFVEKECGKVEACGRLRNKIYGVLLKMAERTALALGTP